jgi:predicted amidohydrolase YtcJ
MMRASTALAVLSALCAVLAMVPHPEQVALQLFRDPASSFRALLSARRRWPSSSRPPDHHPSPGGSGTTGTSGCPLGFGAPPPPDANANAASSSSQTVLHPFSREQRQWFVGAGGGWTGSEDPQEEGPLWIEQGGGFAVDGAGEIAEVAATLGEVEAALERDARSGLLSPLLPTVQLAGAYVIPGIVDPHVHLIPAGLALTSHADLRAVKARGDFEAGVASAALRLLLSWSSSDKSSPPLVCDGSAAAAAAAPSLPWLMGGWWDESRWPGREMPTAEWVEAGLERAAAAAAEQQQQHQHQGEGEGEGEEDDKGRRKAAALDPACVRALPVLLSRMDGHMAVANREALRLARRAAAEAGSSSSSGNGAGGGVLAEGTRELLSLVGEDGGVAAAAAAASSPAGGRFVDPAAGLVREAGLLAVARAAPPPTLAARQAALAAACRYALSKGVTAVGDMGRAPFSGGDASASWDDLEQLYDPGAAAAGAEEVGEEQEQQEGPPLLPIRLAAYLPLETWPRLAARVEARGAVAAGGGSDGGARRGSTTLLAAGVKEFWDGSLGSRTALMTEPYNSSTSTSTSSDHAQGVRMVTSPEQAARLMQRADSAGLQLAVHAIGDLAVDEAAAAFASVAEARRQQAAGGGGAALPYPMRLEHVQHLSAGVAADDDPALRLAALASSGGGGGASSSSLPAAVAVINPQHLMSDASLMQALPQSMHGAAAAQRTHAWRRLSDAAVPLAIGSDWPIVDLDPWAALWAAVHRSAPPEEGEERLHHHPHPQRRHPDGLAAEEALRASTAGAAYAAGLDAWTGRLVPGMKADVVLLDRSVFDDDEEEEEGRAKALSRTRPRVLSTYVGGACRYGCKKRGASEAGSGGA